jgi:hypothetical protein
MQNHWQNSTGGDAHLVYCNESEGEEAAFLTDYLRAIQSSEVLADQHLRPTVNRVGAHAAEELTDKGFAAGPVL